MEYIAWFANFGQMDNVHQLCEDYLIGDFCQLDYVKRMEIAFRYNYSLVKVNYFCNFFK